MTSPPASKIFPLRFLPETSAHLPEAERLLKAGFGAERLKRPIYQLRMDVAPMASLCFMARGEKETHMAGLLRFWPVVLPGPAHGPGEAILFGPLAVDPSLKGRGIGKALVRHGLEKVRDSGAKAVIISGQPDYYKPFGFQQNLVAHLAIRGGTAPLELMGLEWQPRFLEGRKGFLSPAISS